MGLPIVETNRPEPVAAQRQAPVRCRPIVPQDLDAVVALLCVGFPERSAAYWRTGLQRMAARPSPGGVPRFGYVLDHLGAIVGVLLAIHSEGAEDGQLRCNLSSWYVDPRFRGYGVLLDSFAMRNRSVTFLNTSPAPETTAMHEARGFHRHGHGLLLAIPALSRPRPGQTIRPFAEGTDQGLSPREVALAREHAAYGCICLVCTDTTGARLVIFVRRSLQVLPTETRALRPRCWQLVYGLSGPAFAAWAGTIGRYLLTRHFMPLVLLDVEGPLDGVRGHYFGERKPRCVRGPNPPPVGDLTGTEVVVFGP